MATTPPKIAPAADAPAPKKSKTLIIVLAAVLLLAAGGGGAWFFLQSKAEHHEEKVEHAAPPVFLPLDTFVVNLQSEAGDEFLQVNMTVQLQEQKELEVLKTYMPLIRNRILSILSAKKSSDILSPDGKSKLAAELSESIKQPFAKGVSPAKVDGVFFTSFVVQ